MALPHKPVKSRNRLTVALLVSVGVHLLLLPFIAKDAVFHVPKPRALVDLIATPRSMVQHAQRGVPNSTPSAGHSAPELTPTLPPPLAEAEKVKREPLVPGQVVSLGPPQDERPPDKPTHYLSEHDSRVLKETRARKTSAMYKNALSKEQREGKNERAAPKSAPAAPSAVRPGENGGTAAQDAKVAAEMAKKSRQDSVDLQKAPDGTVADRQARDATPGVGGGQKLAFAQPGTAEKADSGSLGIPGLAPGSPGKRGPLTLTLDRPGESLGKVAGGPMSDHLDGVEESDETLLNSRSFKYAGYLNRVKETVGRIWEQRVQDEAMRHDPSGQMYSYKDRQTVVEFSINQSGEVKDVHISVSCGVDYLDRTAVESFRRAERFPNPPPGLVGEDGMVRLPFAFTLLAATGGLRLQIGPAYLPNSPAARGF
jgi:TonB family protein